MNQDTYNLVLFFIACIFALSFILTSYRIIAGPNSMDRLLGLDGVVAMMQCALAAYICWSLDTTVSNAMLVIALLGFISTVAITRFRKKDD
ncbi:monovalent cation/H+ antiporter complex subunit F [Corynebacterium pseudotuberculosis]|uniref:Cation:proton antiporter n=1 Tax=Corynebacterium pseudotuberculosis (strain C231) TaxID=681645 RepID=D9QCI8_CORP2|nr:monovalent cation/H+ antiporter complex subunit F [Corynebacterium pseudotuberculosis]ADK29607.1 cation:proton antiporter [Corynebacterium pseudotuberculosis FRC41]ADL11264.1 cation:proton antiporter [Corynebacterium pseudotuberculosis C231]ADL21680.1 cation:proton antiporter [Corynebacterium pseudotuberculosis 1002]ADO27075.1 cation:proton antiporter [Corynebacterium pseudotuberculosis I19]AEK93138.1 Na(+)/H(+) antiporter subunit F [Corynebacterium pseudotuberculosis PAT10]